MTTLHKYSIGRKFIQAVSGAFLVFFMLLHMTINFFSVIDTFKGKYGVSAPDHEIFSEGDGLFQMGCDFMSLPIVTMMVPVLVLGFLVHIYYAAKLTYENRRARGNARYEVANTGRADSWASKNMGILGLAVVLALVLHLSHFWAKMQLPELTGGHAENPYLLLDATFGNPIIFGIYMLWFVTVLLHLLHGFWSMFQTVGFNNKIWFSRLKFLGKLVSIIIFLGFVVVAVNSFLHAHELFGLKSAVNIARSLM